MLLLGLITGIHNAAFCQKKGIQSAKTHNTFRMFREPSDTWPISTPFPHREVCLNLNYITVITFKNEAAGSRGLSTSHQNMRRHIAEKSICRRYSYYLENGIPVKSRSDILHRLSGLSTLTMKFKDTNTCI
jgi:hypothetical protein